MFVYCSADTTSHLLVQESSGFRLTGLMPSCAASNMNLYRSLSHDGQQPSQPRVRHSHGETCVGGPRLETPGINGAGLDGNHRRCNSEDPRGRGGGLEAEDLITGNMAINEGGIVN